jgi:hypothetical protein
MGKDCKDYKLGFSDAMGGKTVEGEKSSWYWQGRMEGLAQKMQEDIQQFLAMTKNG